MPALAGDGAAPVTTAIRTNETGTILRIDVGRLDAIAAALVQKRQAERQPVSGLVRGAEAAVALVAQSPASGTLPEAEEAADTPADTPDAPPGVSLFNTLRDRITRWFRPDE